MGKIKIHEIAKKFNLASKDVLEIAKRLDIDAKSHLSSVDEEDANKIERELAGNKAEVKNEIKEENKVGNKSVEKYNKQSKNNNISL